MSRRIVLRGRFASQSLRLRPLSLEHFSKETIKAAKHSVGPARENPCPTLAGAVFSQTLHRQPPPARCHQTRTPRVQMRLCPERRGNRCVQRRGGGKMRAVTVRRRRATWLNFCKCNQVVRRQSVVARQPVPLSI